VEAVEAVDEAAGYPYPAEEEVGEPASARTAAATSVGTIMALLPRGAKSTAPVWLKASGFNARKDWVKAMFSTVYD